MALRARSETRVRTKWVTHRKATGNPKHADFETGKIATVAARFPSLRCDVVSHNKSFLRQNHPLPLLLSLRPSSPPSSLSLSFSQPEIEADPYNATRGFFFAHMGWLFVKKHPDVARVGRTLSFADLEAGPVVMFQYSLGRWFSLFMCFVLPGLLARGLWGEDSWRPLWVAGALRYCAVMHCTWLVNSAAHILGDHPYDNDSWASENSLVSLFAGGEG